MKFLINSSGDMAELEKKVYKRDKWKHIGSVPNAVYGDQEIYEIEIESLETITEMCIKNPTGFYGIVIQELGSGQLLELQRSGIVTEAEFGIICYNSWIE